MNKSPTMMCLARTKTNKTKKQKLCTGEILFWFELELRGAQQYIMVDSRFTHSLPQKGPPLKSMKSRAWGVFDTFATHAGFVHVLIDLDYWVQNGSTQQSCFCDVEASSFIKQNQKSIGKLQCIYLLLHSCWQGLGDVSSLWCHLNSRSENCLLN